MQAHDIESAQTTQARCRRWIISHQLKRGSAVSISGGGLNRSTQHFILKEEMECGLMGHRFHRGFTAAEKTELWDRWKRGELLKAIGRAFGKPSSSIYFLVAPAWWDSSCRAASLEAGIDAVRARGDFQRRYGTSIGKIDR